MNNLYINNLSVEQLLTLLPSRYHWEIERRIIELQRIELPEEWKEIYGYNDDYMISNWGNVKSNKKNTRNSGIMKLHLNISGNLQRGGGYYRVCLTKNGINKFCYVHKLVLETFKDNPENKPEGNHIDGNKQNNHLLNLEWCTSSENKKHAYKMGISGVEKRSGKWLQHKKELMS